VNPQNSGPKPRPAVAAALCDPERFIQETATAVRASFCHRVEDVKDYARQQPEKALLSALAAGYVLRGLPVFRIGSTFLRILVTLAKPVGIVYGAAKVWQKLQVAGPAKSSANSEKSAESAGKASGQ
jgi:hypothetical protein